MIKNKAFRTDPELWISYAAFLLGTINEPNRARALLQRATQSVPQELHRYLTSKFGALEFKARYGDIERGRTIFEGLLSAFPRKFDIWDMYSDLEEKHAGDEAEERVRQLFQRQARMKMKGSRGKKLFERWTKWERKHSGEKGVRTVEIAKDAWQQKMKKSEEDAE
jgi:rRNA biogenesis protein RRP5